MHNRFFRRPLILCLVIMSFFCLVLLILYHFAERENTLLKTADGERFLSLATSEAEGAVADWEEGAPVVSIYHHLTAAADYLAMSPHTPQTERITTSLREAGEMLLSGGNVPEEAVEILTYLYESIPLSTSRSHEHTAPDTPQNSGKAESTPATEKAPSSHLSAQADKITATTGLLHPMDGDGLVYGCDNMYVRLSPGGIPVEMAVYPPLRYAPAYSEVECHLLGGRLLETVLPGFYARPGGTEMVEQETDGEVCRCRYHWQDKQVETVVRRDTGRMVYLRIVPWEA